MGEPTRRCLDCTADISARHGNAKRCTTCAEAECDVDGCTERRRFIASGRWLCGKHHARWQRNGDPEKLVRLPVTPISLPEEMVHEVAEISDLDAGIAAEHLVCADLLLGGWRAFLTDQNCPYDLAVEVDGRLIRVQVKATRRCRPIPQRAVHTPGYIWHVKRAGKKGRRRYGVDEFDLIALVALDIRKIAYLPASTPAQSIVITPPGASSGKQFADYPFTWALAEVSGDAGLRTGGRIAIPG